MEKPVRRTRSDVPGQLIVAARETLADTRPSEITVRHIAARAGLQHSLITRHFGSRDALLAAAMGDVLAELGEVIDGAEDLDGAISACVERPGSDPALTSAVFVLLSQGDRPSIDRYPLVEALERKLQTRGLDGRAARETAVAMTVLVTGWSAAEPWWLQVIGGSGDPQAGRAVLRQALWSLVESAVRRST